MRSKYVGMTMSGDATCRDALTNFIPSKAPPGNYDWINQFICIGAVA